MSKKLLISLAVICVLILAFVGISLKKDNVIRIAAAGYPMDEIVKIAAEDLKKEGYDVKITVLTDYVTANVGLNAKSASWYACTSDGIGTAINLKFFFVLITSFKL